MNEKEKQEAQKEAQEVLNWCLLTYHLKLITIKIKAIRRGKACCNNRFISIPLWAYDRGLSYFYYYILHEVSHFICFDKFNCFGHTGVFKRIEQEVLKEFDLIPMYKKVYINSLINGRGQELYHI